MKFYALILFVGFSCVVKSHSITLKKLSFSQHGNDDFLPITIKQNFAANSLLITDENPSGINIVKLCAAPQDSSNLCHVVDEVSRIHENNYSLSLTPFATAMGPKLFLQVTNFAEQVKTNTEPLLERVAQKIYQPLISKTEGGLSIQLQKDELPLNLCMVKDGKCNIYWSFIEPSNRFLQVIHQDYEFMYAGRKGFGRFTNE